MPRVPLIVWITRAENEALASVARARGLSVEDVARVLLFPTAAPMEEPQRPSDASGARSWAAEWVRCIADLPRVLDDWQALTAEEKEAAEGRVALLCLDHPEEEHPADGAMWALHRRIADVMGFDIAAVWPASPAPAPAPRAAALRYPPASAGAWWAPRPCTRCGAPAGFHCITSKGKRAALIHAVRTITAKPPAPPLPPPAPEPLVRLTSSQGEIERAVVEDRGDVLMVCRPEEMEAARREGREPHTVGFRTADVIAADPPPSAALARPVDVAAPAREPARPPAPAPPPVAKVSDPPTPRPPARDPGNVVLL